MKHLITIAFISTYLFSNGQSESYWNNYANFNPAMSGFQHKMHAMATYYNYYPSLSGSCTGLFADAGIRFAENQGIGVVYTGDFNSYSGSHKALVNYNYQFRFEKAGKLSIGTGVGFGRYSIVDALSSTITQVEKRNSFELNLGASYKFKKLFVGFSVTNLIPAEDPDHPFIILNPSPRSYNLHAEHTADIAQKFQLATRLLYSYQGGFQRLQPNLTLIFLEQFSLGASYEFRNSFGINAGWDIFNQFRVAYNYSSTVSKLSNGVGGGQHEISIGYLFKNRIAKITRTKE